MTEEEHLNHSRDTVEAATERAEELTEGLSSEQLLWKPAPEKWSIAECFEHLILAGKGWYPNIRHAIQNAAPAPPGEKREYRPSWLGSFFLGMTGRKVKMAMPTAPMFEPEGEDLAGAPQRFLEQQDELLQLIEDARGFHLLRARAAFPQWSWMSLRLGDALALVVNHQHRHLRQAEAVMQTSGFPAAAAPTHQTAEGSGP